MSLLFGFVLTLSIGIPETAGVLCSHFAHMWGPETAGAQVDTF